MIYTTLKKIEDAEACKNRLKVLLDALPHHNRTKKIPLNFILDTNGINDTMWLFINNCDIGNNDIFIRKFAAWCAWQCLDNYEKEYPNCSKVRDCLECVDAFINGNATKDELSATRSAAESAARSARSAAGSAAWSAARSAAWSAAWSAGWSAWSVTRSAESAAGSAAWSAAWSARSAARSAAEKKQTEQLHKMLKDHTK